MKKVISVVLAIVIACVMSASVYGTTVKDARTPTIVVSGMDFTGLRIDLGKETERNLLGEINAGEIILTIATGLVKTMLMMDAEGFTSAIFTYASKILEGYSFDENGESVYDVSPHNEYPLAVENYDNLAKADDDSSAEKGVVKSCIEAFGADRTYFYYYDWRLDPFDNADDLNELAETAMKDANADKINIICCSMGGVETLAYMTKYGTSQINSCTFLCSTVYGAYVVSDVLQGKIKLTPNSAMNFLSSLAGQDSEIVLGVLKYTGIGYLVGGLAECLVDNLKEGAFNEVLKPNFATMPVLWALVLPEEYEATKEYCFGGEEEKYAKVIEKADRLQEMMKNRNSMLDEAVKNGMKISFVSNYNKALAPVYERSETQGDGVLETALMAGGATVANLGKTLDVKEGKYVSADKVIDASTCLYPEYTWFVKDAPHIACRYDSTYSDFIIFLVTSEAQPTIETNSLYPQFMYADEGQNVYALK